MEHADHYFMLDFCYFSNLLQLFYLFMYPTSAQLFVLNFANANGPLLWSIIAWRNSLVFHDLDKITSVFIHAFPPIVSFVIKNFDESRKYISYETCARPSDNITSSCTVSWGEVIVPHVVFFAFWQTCYYLKTEVIDRDRMRKNQTLVTSFRWMRQYKRSPVYKILNSGGFAEKYQVFVFMALQFLYHLITVIPVKLMYDYPLLHSIVLVYVFVQCVHNGSNFYIEKFSSSYLKRLEEIANSLHTTGDTTNQQQKQQQQQQSKQHTKNETASEDVSHSVDEQRGTTRSVLQDSMRTPSEPSS